MGTEGAQWLQDSLPFKLHDPLQEGLSPLHCSPSIEAKQVAPDSCATRQLDLLKLI